jgi:hypothetical protein
MIMYRENFEFQDVIDQKEIITTEKEAAPEATPLSPQPKKTGIRIKELIDGTVLVREDTRKQLPFVIFLTFLGIIYIGNRFYSERLVRQINDIKAEVSNLRSEQITITSELMNISRPSEVADLVKQKNLGLYESMEPSKKLMRK